MKDGEILRQWIKEREYTLEEVANLMGYSNKSVVRAMYDTGKFRLKTQKDLFEKLGFKKNDSIIARVGNVNKSKENSIITASGDVIESSIEKMIVNSHSKGNIKDFTIIGNNMFPTFCDGDIVRTFEVPIEMIKTGYTYVIVYDNNTKIKCRRVQNLIDSKGYIVLKSDNNDYDDNVNVLEANINKVYQVNFYISQNMKAPASSSAILKEIKKLMNG